MHKLPRLNNTKAQPALLGFQLPALIDCLRLSIACTLHCISLNLSKLLRFFSPASPSQSQRLKLFNFLQFDLQTTLVFILAFSLLASMDQKNNVRVVEEEKFGWTILSTVQDGDQAPCEAKLASQQEADLLLGNETDERGAAVDNHGDNPSVSEQKGAEENEESDEAEEFAHDEKDDDADDELEDCGFDDGGDDGDETKVIPFGDSSRGFLWDPEPRQEASTKQVLVEQQPGQKQGLMWRVSLVATLGFFGWAVMSSFSGGGKNIRCLKLHPCSIKEGEPVLSTL